MATLALKGRCRGCGARFEAPGPGKYTCRDCQKPIVVKNLVPKPKPAQQPREMTIRGFIPWEALDPQVKAAYVHARKRIKSGQGPGSALAKATKLLGIKPCRGCKRRMEALNNLGWWSVLIFAGAVAGVTLALAWTVI